MSTLISRLLAGALAAGLAGSAAQAQVHLQGGGSTMTAPYWAQAAGCWDSDPGNGTYYDHGIPVSPSVPPTCIKTIGSVVSFVAAGSGAGQAFTFAHDGGRYGSNYLGAVIFPIGGVQYGLSDNDLVDSDIGVYVVGTGANYVPPNSRPAIMTPATYQGLTFGAGSGLPNDYPVPKPQYGPLLQFPIAIVPVAITYNPTYKTGFTLNLPAGTPLKLDAAAYCKIFTGAITDWGDGYLASINSVGTLKASGDTTAAPIKLVGDSNASGATSIFTRHLAAACDSVLVSNPYTAGTLQLPAAVVSLFTLASGSSGMATAVNANTGSIGYISPSYILPAVNSIGLNTYNLPAAQLKNAAGNYIAASGSAATAAFAAISPPSTAAQRADATLWVQGTAKTVPLANPTASAAYPIVGTTNFISYACYASVNKVNTLRAFLNFGGTAQAASLLSSDGLAQLPSAWLTAISNTFVNPTNGPANAGLNLYFAEAVSGSNGLGRTNSNCTASGVVGG